MPRTPHHEKHFTATDTVRDIVIGMSDGLTVPFALAAGLSGAIAASGVVVTAGFAEMVAGSISMGLGGYLAARSDAEHYASERKREWQEVKTMPEQEEEEVRIVFRKYGVPDEDSEPVLEAFRKHPKSWIDFMMQFELGLEKPDPKRALKSAATIAGAYAVGGLVPLLPYILIPTVPVALEWSVIVTGIALTIFGAVKAHFTGAPLVRGAFQTLIIGGLAAGAAFLIARAIA